MAATHVALLRGINVGTAKRVAMADLRALMESLGYADVRTLLNSGNVVFSAPRAKSGEHAARIERAIAKQLGVQSRVTVLTAPELDAAVRGNTLLKLSSHPSRLLVGVLASRDHRNRLEPLVRQRWAPEGFALGDRVCYLWCPEGILKSRAAVAVDELVGDAITSRNWATIQKLHTLLHAEKG